jgi:hypothetical protein
MLDDSELDPVEEQAVPIVLAIGRAVLGAAALEKLLLVDIAQRVVERDGFTAELSAELTSLERESAGRLLGRLRELGIPDDLGERIQDVIRRRNRLVHHALEDADLMIAVATGKDVDAVVTRIDQIAVDSQQIGNEVIAVAFPGLEAALGVSLPQLVEIIAALDLDTIEDEALRAQFQSARRFGCRGPRGSRGDGERLGRRAPPAGVLAY